ncbi:MAG: hypothetical protein BAA01_09120 [Bacillus thermozeamaize]|uniref:Type 4 fimbrial biogenesis protein PilX N-terminal domain-containing protein n=1 Tax=Bacillus thermozeamaize TaxID=230954 RepID=A0A1Y3PSC3_9BACI|nr:MAG: hypothetical protein BAA01_09120 [Bacillus thermozeamaize]
MIGCQKPKGQKGSALVVIALIILLSSVLGLALLSNTLTSHQSVLANENETRAKYLAEYAATLGLDELQKELEELSQQSGQQVRQCGEIDDIVRELLNKFANKSGVPVEQLKGEDFVYRLEFDESSLQEAKNLCEQNSAIGLQYAVKGYLVASGIADKNGKLPKRVTFKVPIQITNVADVFNFALSAKENIWLNGGVEIHGSLYAGNALAFNKVAHFYDGYRYHFTSVYPEINGKISAGSPEKKGNEIYEITYYDSKIIGNHNIKEYGSKVSIEQLNRKFYGNYKVSKVSFITFPDLDMNQIKEEIKTVTGFYAPPDSSRKTIFHKQSHGVDYYYITDAERVQKCTGEWGNRKCWYEWRESTTTFPIGANYGISKKGPYRGVYYINGKLDIDGDVDLQGTFYVNGDVSMQHTQKTDNPIAAAIIAKGEITIANNNLYQDDPAILNAFFWSLSDDFVIYGVGSNLKINGGVIAKNIVLNGLRGSKNGKTISPNPQEYKDKNGKKWPSRLTIVYDEQFITHPPAGVPTNEGFKLSQIGQWEYVEE